MMPDIAENLQARTENLRNEIEWIKAGRGEEAQAVLEHLSRVRSEVSACGDLIRDLRFASAGTAAQKAASEYRVCLQRLHEALPILQSELFAQQSQLRPQREHVNAATEWLQCGKTTLG